MMNYFDRVDICEEPADCQDPQWFGLTDEKEEGVWVDIFGKQLPTNSTLWKNPPTGGIAKNCAVNSYEGISDEK